MAITPLKYCPVEYSQYHGEYIPQAERLLGKGMKPYIYDFFASKAVSATAVELLPARGITTALSVQNGGSYTKVAVISASTDDNSSGSACVVSLKVWGVDSNHNYNLVTATMSGTTSASASTSMYEVNNCYVHVFGTSDQNAAGSIKVSMTGKTSKAVLAITSADNYGDNCRVWLPKNWKCKILHVHGFLATETQPSEVATVFPQYYDAYSNKDYDGSLTKVTFSSGGGQFGPDSFPRIYGNANTVGKLTFYGVATATETVSVAVRLMLWLDKPSAESTQLNSIVGY